MREGEASDGGRGKAFAWCVAGEKLREEQAHNRKADMAQRTPGVLASEALRTMGFPAYGTRKPVRYAIDAMYALPPAEMIRYAQRGAQGQTGNVTRHAMCE